MSEPRWPKRKSPLVVVILAITGNALLLWDAPHLFGFIAAFLLTCLLPGYLAIQIIFPRRSEVDILESAALSLGAGYASLITGGLALHYLPGPITLPLVLVAYDIILLCLLIPYTRQERSKSSVAIPKSALIQASLLIAIAAFFCFTYLGYSEFQGDEAIVMLKATAAVRGDDNAILVHKKGPAEILIPAIFYASQGQVNEWMARLPFALAALAGLLAVYQLGRSMFNPFVGLMAGLLLAINGFLVAFARVVQYQSLVLLMSTLALLCYYRFSQDEAPARRHLFLGTLFLGVGMLAHYDAIFVSPAMTYLIFHRWRSNPSFIKGDLKVGLGAGIFCAALLAAFYVPMMQHPYFNTVSLNYWGVRVGKDILHNTLPTSFVLGTFYNSTYYIGFLVVTMAFGVVRHLASLPRRWVGVLLSLILFCGSAVALLQPQWWRFDDLDATFFFLTGLLLAPMVLSTPSVSWKTSWLWFAAPLVFFACLVRFPRTHFHIALPALILLSASTLDQLRLKLKGMSWGWAAALGLAVAYLIFAYYTYIVLIQHDPEYRRTYPATKHPFYWTAYDRLPSSGWFGFPYRAGWKVIGALYAEGELRGDYDSNEEPFITHWYTRGAPRCPENPRYYILAEDVQDEYEVPREVIRAQYGEIGQVTVEGWPRILIYERGATTIPTVYALEDYETGYDRELSGASFNPSIPYGSPLPYIEHSIEVNFSNKVRLLGYSLDSAELQPGGIMMLTLYWEAVTRIDQDYQVFVHLEKDGRIWGQGDHTPGICHQQEPTSTWRPSRIVTDRCVVSIDPDTPAGRYPLLVGLYDWQTLERLEIIGPTGEPAGNSVLLQEVEVGEAS